MHTRTHAFGWQASRKHAKSKASKDHAKRAQGSELNAERSIAKSLANMLGSFQPWSILGDSAIKQSSNLASKPLKYMSASQITSNYMELQPAYGRNPKTKQEAIELFHSGKDWIGDYTINFAYCSVRDFAKGTKVLLRYKGNSEVCEVTV